MSRLGEQIKRFGVPDFEEGFDFSYDDATGLNIFASDSSRGTSEGEDPSLIIATSSVQVNPQGIPLEGSNASDEGFMKKNGGAVVVAMIIAFFVFGD